MTSQRPVEARQIAATVHGHYLVAVPRGAGPHPLLVGFHGYGQTAREAMDELQRLPGGERWLLCAVQGLSAFYLGRTGEVGASWMTRFNRELAIADNLRYVASVVDEVEGRYPVSGVRVYAGFSQGVAMAYRVAALSGRIGRGVLALAGDLPPELGAGDLQRLARVLIGQGETDELYPGAKLDADLGRLREAGVETATSVFAGGHEWSEVFRSRAGEWLGELLEAPERENAALDERRFLPE